MIRGTAFLLPLLFACSSGDKEEQQKKCDTIESNIRASAKARALDSNGICSRPSPDFQGACDQLRQCQAELAEM